MRLYGITNMYMTGIHAGIQTQHSTGEMFLKYTHTTPQYSTIMTYLEFHKTTIAVNGGMHDNLINILALMEKWEAEEEYEVLPFAPFYEPGVNNALTSISIVMPQDAVDYMDAIRKTAPDSEEYSKLKLAMYNSYGRYGIPVLEAIAFLPLAK